MHSKLVFELGQPGMTDFEEVLLYYEEVNQASPPSAGNALPMLLCSVFKERVIPLFFSINFYISTLIER